MRILKNKYDKLNRMVKTLLDMSELQTVGRDDENNVISAGLASVAYQVGNSTEHVLHEDFTTSIRTEVKFSIPEEKLPAAGADITVKAVDNAGNRAEKKITVRIHTHKRRA